MLLLTAYEEPTLLKLTSGLNPKNPSGDHVESASSAVLLSACSTAWLYAGLHAPSIPPDFPSLLSDQQSPMLSRTGPTDDQEYISFFVRSYESKIRGAKVS